MDEDRYLEFIDLFNERMFYDCHEALEDLWLDHFDGRRQFYQGMIHLATAFQHLLRRKMEAFATRLASARHYLEPYPDMYQGLDLASIRDAIDYWSSRLEACGPDEVLRYDDSRVPVLRIDESSTGPVR